MVIVRKSENTKDKMECKREGVWDYIHLRSIAVKNTMTKNNLGSKGFISSYNL